MKRILFVLYFLIVGIALAYPNEYPPISPENVMNLHEVETIGQGSLSGGLAWSPDGSKIVTGGARGIFIFDSNYQNVGFIDMGKPVSILEYAPDGSFVFAYFDGKVNAFDLETRTVRYQLSGTSILAMSKNEQMLAYAGYRSVIVADIATGETRYVLDYDNYWQAEYSDGYAYRANLLVFAQFINNDAQLLVRWAVEERYEEFPYGGYFPSTDIWTLADASFEALKDDANAERFEDEFVAYDSAGNVFRVNDSYWHRDELSVALFPPESSVGLKSDDYRYSLDGDLFAAPVGSWSDSEDYWGIDASQTGIWNINTGELLTIVPRLGHVVFSPDKAKIALGNEIFDLITGERLAILQNDTYRALLRVNDRILQYGADDSLRLLDAMSMEEIAVLPMKRSELKEIREIFSDGSFLLVDNSGLHYIRVSGKSGGELANITVQQAFGCLKLSQNERYFFCDYSSAYYVLDGVWNADTGQKIEFPAGFVPLLPRFEENQVIGWTVDKIGFFDLSLRNTVEEISLAGTGYEDRGQATALRMSSDGQYLAVFFNREGVVISRSTGETIASFVGGADFSPSSSLLAYSDAEMNIWVMNLSNGEMIQSWYVPPLIGYLGGVYFQSEEILVVILPGVDGGGESRTYNPLTGREAYPNFVQQAAVPQPFAEVNGLRFYNNNGLRIEWNEQPISITLNPANFSSASLSSDATRLYINYSDGRVGIWAVGE